MQCWVDAGGGISHGTADCQIGCSLLSQIWAVDAFGAEEDVNNSLGSLCNNRNVHEYQPDATLMWTTRFTVIAPHSCLSHVLGIMSHDVGHDVEWQNILLVKAQQYVAAVQLTALVSEHGTLVSRSWQEDMGC